MKKVGNALLQLMEDLSRSSINGEARVKVNSNLASPEEFKHLFNHFTKGTVLERVELNVESVETRLNCVCGNEDMIETDSHNGYQECPECGRIAEVDNSQYELLEPTTEKLNSHKRIQF